jgi:hypothetical protein
MRTDLALPPESSESFVREVDENLRRDQMALAAKKYGNLAIIAAGLFLLAVGGYLYWQDRQAKAAQIDTEQLYSTLEAAQNPADTSVAASLDKLAQSDAEAVSASARLSRAALALQTNDRKTALSIYTAMSADKGLEQAYRDLALVRATALEFDALKPDQVISRLQPLAQTGQPFFGSAGEMTALAMLAKGQKTQAGQLFAKLAADKDVPETIRSRAVQIASSLGVDASAALPAVATAQ